MHWWITPRWRYTDLKAKANLCGFTGRNGSVKKATKKHTPAPIRHAPNPNSLNGWELRVIPENVQPSARTATTTTCPERWWDKREMTRVTIRVHKLAVRTRCHNCGLFYGPIPTWQCKISFLLIAAFIRPQRDIASTDGVIKSRKWVSSWVGWLRLLLSLWIVCHAASPTKLGEVCTEILFCRRCGCHFFQSFVDILRPLNTTSRKWGKEWGLCRWVTRNV